MQLESSESLTYSLSDCCSMYFGVTTRDGKRMTEESLISLVKM